MTTFADYRRDKDVDTISGSDGQVGDLVLTCIELKAAKEFKLPALFTITEVHGKPGWLKYTLCHHPSGKTVGPMEGAYFYKAHEYLELLEEYNAYVIRSLERELARQQGFVDLLKSVLVERGTIPIITDDELQKLKELAAKAE